MSTIFLSQEKGKLTRSQQIMFHIAHLLEQCNIKKSCIGRIVLQCVCVTLITLNKVYVTMYEFHRNYYAQVK